MHAKSTHANGTVACDGTHLYIGFLNNGEVHATCLDLAGEIQWQTPLGPFTPQFGYAPSPVIHEGLVIFAADNPGSGYLAAVHRESGDIVWRKPRRAGTSYATANVIPVAGTPQLVIGGLRTLASFDPLTGELNWSCDGLSEAVVGSAVGEGELVFASAGYPDAATLCVNATTGQEVWHNDINTYEPSLLVLDGYLYSQTKGGILYCWNATTGAEQWKHRIGGDVSSSLVAHGDVVYATNEAGQTTVFRANPAQYEELAQNQLGAEGFASPAISRGRLYIRTATGDGPRRQEKLYCIGK
jgi:outer membrane protein assembly factor BamB